MRNEIVVQKMAGYVAKVLNYCQRCTYDSFVADTKLVEICVFNFSLMKLHVVLFCSARILDSPVSFIILTTYSLLT